MGDDVETYLTKLEAAFVDLLDGNSDWYNIQDNTGLSQNRCKEISKLFKIVLNKYERRHRI